LGGGRYHECLENIDKGNSKLRMYSLLAMGLRQLEQDSNAVGEGSLLIKKVLQQKPDIPLANHYLGKKFYKSGNWQEAEQYLLQAIKYYDDESNLKIKLKVEIDGDSLSTKDSCLLSLLLHYSYDVLEDHYILGELYEEHGFYNEAVEQYKMASGIENRRQIDQANLTNFEALTDTSLYARWDRDIGNIAYTFFGIPISMGGAIKLARLYDRLGEFLLEEKILLTQVSFNRAAGYARRVASTKIPEWELFLNRNYWLLVNKDVEVETCNFYKRMTDSFPRDPEWQEKGGLFLYNRLALTYNQIPVKDYSLFNRRAARYLYPWTGEDISNETEANYYDTANNIIDVSTPPSQIIGTFVLPGTGEEINFESIEYEPVEKALEYLTQSVKLGGDSPRKEIQEAIADLNSWLGNFDVAANVLKSEITTQPENASVRNKLINFLTQQDEYLDAKKHLDSLYNRNQIRNEQLLILSKYHILSNSFAQADSLLKAYKPGSVLDMADQARQKITLYWLENKQEKALKYALDSFPKVQLVADSELVGYDTRGAFYRLYRVSVNNQLKYFQLYSVARLYAKLKQDDRAFVALKLALDSGFSYRNVLENDNVWDRFRKSKRWKYLLEKYQNHIDYGYSDNVHAIYLMEYMVPAAADGKIF
jgi:Tfp pilus assembly protein PilF